MRRNFNVQDTPEDERGEFRGGSAVAGRIQLGDSCEVEEEDVGGTDEHESRRHEPTGTSGASGGDLFRWTPSKETSGTPSTATDTSAEATGRPGAHSAESADCPGVSLDGNTRGAESSAGSRGGGSSQASQRGRSRPRTSGAEAAAGHNQRLAEEILAAEREELLEEEEGEEDEENEVYEDMDEHEAGAEKRQDEDEDGEGRGQAEQEEGRGTELQDEEGEEEEEYEDTMEEDEFGMELVLSRALAHGQQEEGEEEEEDLELDLVQRGASAEELRQLAVLREVDMEELEEEEEGEGEEDEGEAGGGMHDREGEGEEERMMDLERDSEDDSLLWLSQPLRTRPPRFPSPVSRALGLHDPIQEALVGPQHFNLGLASLHTYLGELEALSGAVRLGKAGEVLRIPVLYLEGMTQESLPCRHTSTRSQVNMHMKNLSSVAAPAAALGCVTVYYCQGSFNSTMNRIPLCLMPRVMSLCTTAKDRSIPPCMALYYV